MKKMIAGLVLTGIIIVAVLCIRYIPMLRMNSDTSNDDMVNNSFEEDTEEIYNKHEIPIYTINYDTIECEPSLIVAPDSKQITERYIVDEVIANFRENISIYDVITDNNSVIVSFNSGSAPAVNVSKEMETAMLNCISYSLIDNIESCNRVVFRIEEGSYNSTYINMEYDESYVEK